MKNFLFDKINIIGLGLIGGSIAKSCYQYNLSKYITGFDKDKAVISLALENKIINQQFDFKSKINDLTIIASPLSSYRKVFAQLKTNNSIIIDIGSLQSCVINWAQDNAINFIACHPIAGSDKSGITNANANLFLNKKVIISTTKDNKQEYINKIKLFWHKIGSVVEFVNAIEHDRIFSLVSHLPQFLAFVAKENHLSNNILLNKHFRLQNSNPKIWQEIFILNQDNIKHYLKNYLGNIDVIIKNLNENKFQEIINIILRPNFIKQQQQIIKPLSCSLSLIRRMILVSCFLNIIDIRESQPYCGNGFKDFISVSCYFDNLTKKHLQDHQLLLIEFLNYIKLQITNYEFK